VHPCWSPCRETAPPRPRHHRHHGPRVRLAQLSVSDNATLTSPLTATRTLAESTLRVGERRPTYRRRTDALTIFCGTPGVDRDIADPVPLGHLRYEVFFSFRVTLSSAPATRDVRQCDGCPDPGACIRWASAWTPSRPCP
jgi:hypothetical protein